ncbi:MAG: protein TolR [Zetaproteobacteria bacterium CG2_30_46_52]|nr:MAG: protein TolR [Zetaproteobacteria bacterium CG2_30_46_52]
MWKNRSEWSTDHQPMSQINITPMVDVMLVLLIIFMVAAPMLTQGVNVDLPDTNAPQIRQQVEPLVISVRANGDLFLQNKQVELNQISPRIAAMRKVKPDLPVFIRGDAKTPYEHVARLMSSLESAGIKQISLVTEPQK